VLDSLDMECVRELLMSLYHRGGAGRKPYSPVSMLKAQLLKHLRCVPSDRRLLVTTTSLAFMEFILMACLGLTSLYFHLSSS
jgi:hypothetical protein